MKSDLFKKMIKQAVREAIREEMRDVLVEAVRMSSPNAPAAKKNHGTINESTTTHQVNVDPQEVRSKYADMIEGMGRGATNIQFDSAHAANFRQSGYRPSPVNTTGEGSSLPAGEVSLDQIMGLMIK